MTSALRGGGWNKVLISDSVLCLDQFQLVSEGANIFNIWLTSFVDGGSSRGRRVFENMTSTLKGTGCGHPALLVDLNM